MGGIKFLGPTTIIDSVIAGDHAVIHMGRGRPAPVATPPAVASPPVARPTGPSLIGGAWDVFLCHASPDKAAWARPLHDALVARTPAPATFLDEVSVPDGVDGDAAIVGALRASRVVAVLVSDRAESAYYQREEIREAIAAAREDPAVRVVPVGLGGWPGRLPFGLGLKQGFVAEDVGAAAERLHRVVLEVARPARLALLLERLAPSAEELAACVAGWAEVDPLGPVLDHAGVAARARMDGGRFEDWARRWPEHRAAIASVRRLWG